MYDANRQEVNVREDIRTAPRSPRGTVVFLPRRKMGLTRKPINRVRQAPSYYMYNVCVLEYYREGRLYHPRLEENVFELQQQAKRPDWWLSVGSVRLHVNVRVAALASASARSAPEHSRMSPGRSGRDRPGYYVVSRAHGWSA